MAKIEPAKIEHTAHDTAPMGMAGHDHHKTMMEDFEKEFWICILITIPLLVFSPTIQHFFGYHLLLPGNKYILLVLSSFLFFGGGCFF